MLSTIPIVVTSVDDSGTGTLRDAITTADSGSAGDSYVITFASAVIGAINLESALPDLDNNITIQGPGAESLTVQRDTTNPTLSSFRIFTVDAGKTVSISGLRIANGNAGSGNGGGLDNFGTVTVSNSVFTSNSAVFGAGLDNESTSEGNGTASVSGSGFTSNSALGDGGGLYNNNGGTVTVGFSAFTRNSAGVDGGGLFNGGTAFVGGSTFAANSASNNGGGIYDIGTLIQASNTFTGNIPNNVAPATMAATSMTSGR